MSLIKRSVLSVMDSQVIPLWFAVAGLPVVGALLLIQALYDKKRISLGVLMFAGCLGVSLGCLALLRWRSRLLRQAGSMPVVHSVELCRDLPNFYSHCSCGWMSDDRSTYEAALLDARGHGVVGSSKVAILDDPEGADAYEIEAADAELPHVAMVYNDHGTYVPACSCGWNRGESQSREQSLKDARGHARSDDVEVVDIGEVSQAPTPDRTG